MFNPQPIVLWSNLSLSTMNLEYSHACDAYASPAMFLDKQNYLFERVKWDNGHTEDDDRPGDDDGVPQAIVIFWGELNAKYSDLGKVKVARGLLSSPVHVAFMNGTVKVENPRLFNIDVSSDGVVRGWVFLRDREHGVNSVHIEDEGGEMLLTPETPVFNDVDGDKILVEVFIAPGFPPWKPRKAGGGVRATGSLVFQNRI